MSSDDEALIDTAIFQEPPDYYPPPKPATFESRTLQGGQTLRLRLVGHNPLWVVTDYLYDHKESLVRGTSMLELGAGAGLPSIAAAIWGAKHVVVTDYPDQDLVENMKINVDAATDVVPRSSNIVVQHAALVSTIRATLARSPQARALVFFTPYTPWKFDKDMAFFDVAREGGFEVNQVVKRVMDKVMFQDDPGDELLRRTVFGYELSWNDLDI
ncbi:MAG: hypothetical protein LQ345_003745 [Seirophora villosa]|nr:MAG: hypothetical protein LQ345_003745 [Seirophora villosa]